MLFSLFLQAEHANPIALVTPYLLIGVAFYLLLFSPMQRQKKRQAEMLKGATGWICLCGQSNAEDHLYCTECGSPFQKPGQAVPPAQHPLIVREMSFVKQLLHPPPPNHPPQPRPFTCKICDQGTMVPKKMYRMSGPAVVIGFILLIPSILGIIFSVLVFFAGVLGFSHEQQYAQEMTAVKAISTVHTAETQYYSQYGQYATSLQQLGPPASGSPGPNGADLIDRDLASGEKRGFKFVLFPTESGYALYATPVVFGTSGTHTYFSDQSMTIHQHNGPEPATPNDPVLGEKTSETPAGSASPSGLGVLVGGAFATAIGIPSLVAGLLGWLLVMKKRVLQCSVCGAVVNSS